MTCDNPKLPPRCLGIGIGCLGKGGGGYNEYGNGDIGDAVADNETIKTVLILFNPKLS